MQPELVIFDLDGTIADTSPGIYDCYDHIAEVFGLPRYSHEELLARSTGNLEPDLASIYGLDPEATGRALREFLDFYTREAYLHADIYPGIRELIEEIHARGIKLAVATMKIEEYAVQQIDHWGLTDRFVSINGADELGTLTKSDLIDRALYSAGVGPGDAVMIGDTPGDHKGAARSGVPFIAVTYGFVLREDVCESNGIPYAADAEGLRRILFPGT